MSTKRKKNNGWEWIVKRAALLKKPYYYTDTDEARGDERIARLEAMLDQGIVPPELLDQGAVFLSLGKVIRAYMTELVVPDNDVRLLNVLYERIGNTKLHEINYEWVINWIRNMKVELNLSPGTIRHYVGALARCFDWAAKKNIVALALNPLRTLPKRYAQYNSLEVRDAKDKNPDYERREDLARDRRLEKHEEESIRNVITEKYELYSPKGVEKHYTLELYQAATALLFELAIETAMRMREIYTIALDRVDLERRTIFLDKTKNGDNRQVPLSTVAIAAIKKYLEFVGSESGEKVFSFRDDLLFPWWNGSSLKDDLRSTTSALSTKFSRIFDQAGCSDFRFHDLRHEATSRLFEKTNLRESEIQKITGHKNAAMLARYANLRGSDLASALW